MTDDGGVRAECDAPLRRAARWSWLSSSRSGEFSSTRARTTTPRSGRRALSVMARSGPLCWYLLVVALAAAHALKPGRVAVQYEDGQAQQVVEAVSRLGYTVTSSVPEARALFLDPPAAQQASALSAAGAAAPSGQGLSGVPGITSAQPVGVAYLAKPLAETDNTSPMPQPRSAAATSTTTSDIAAATDSAAEATTASRAPPPPSPPPPAPCPALARSSGHGSERIAWGVDRVQAMDKLMLNVSKTLANNVLICTIALGLNPALAAEWPPNISGCLPSVAGKKSPCKYAWNESYGIPVSDFQIGIMSARWNGVGVVGAAPFNTAIYHINVAGPSFYFSVEDAMNAVSECVAELDRRKARNRNLRMVLLSSWTVLNDTAPLWEAQATALAARGDVLWFAEAGDLGDDYPIYPAAAKDVVSVAATAADDTHPVWSTANAAVDLAAPGKGVLTIAGSPKDPSLKGIGLTAAKPGGGLLPFLDDLRAAPFVNSARINATGRLMDCGYGHAPCRGAAGAICLMKDDDTAPFCDMVANCTAAGGVGVIIYYGSGCLPGQGYLDLNNPPCLKTPTIGTTSIDGANLAAAVARGPVTASILFADQPIPTGLFSSTGFSSAHAAIVAAVVWSAFPTCSASRIRSALQASAKDLGAPGRDPQFGYGLVQARAAHDYLKAHPC